MPQRALRILVVGVFQRRNLYRNWGGVDYKLANGLTRLGHNVIRFSDRDVARESNPLGRKALGKAPMIRKLLGLISHYQPDLILLGHCDMTDNQVIEQMKQTAPNARVAQFNVDSTERLKTMASFSERASVCDMSFITTADKAALQPLAPRPDSIAYFPNPTDSSIETGAAWRSIRTDLSFDGIFIGSGIERREQQLTELMDALPPSFRFRTAGGVFDSEKIASVDFLEALAECAMSPNLPLDDQKPVPLLYSSDRISQLLGQGLLTLCHATAGLEAVYEDGIETYRDPTELAAKMAELSENDDRRRKIAEKGWRIAHERTNATRVANYMLDLIFEQKLSCAYEWPTDPIA